MEKGKFGIVGLGKSSIETRTLSAKTDRPKTERITEVARELSNRKYVEVVNERSGKVESIASVFVPFSKGDLDLAGKPTDGFISELEAVSAVLSKSFGYSRRNTDERKNWNFVNIRFKRTVESGKAGYAISAIYTGVNRSTAKAEAELRAKAEAEKAAKRDAAKAKRERNKKAKQTASANVTANDGATATDGATETRDS
jgi:hypothetical protein